MRRLTWCALLVCLAGCAIGRTAENDPISPETVGKLQPGKSTSLEVVELLGAPVDVIQLGRRSAYLYKHTREKSTGIVLILVNFLNQDQRQDRVWVFFDESNVLTHVGSTYEADDTRVAAPWMNLYKKKDGEPGPAENANKIATEPDAEPGK
jgi:outer membrane protein assembly factor BamE (lipoprotein component of BamABCDE complex)